MLRFRDILKERQESTQTSLYSALDEMQKVANGGFSALLGQTHKSYNGGPHCANIEAHLDRAVPYHLKQQFSSTEIFLLLSSILVHDIGKIFSNKGDDHSKESCLKILKNWPQIKIPEDLVQWLAVLVCSHTWKNPNPPTECQYRGNQCVLCGKSGGQPYSQLSCKDYYQEDLVRLEWLGALLRLGDEVDHQKERSIKPWVLKEGEETSWRYLINSVIFDTVGECIKLKTLNLDRWNKENKGYLKEALEKINNVLRGWKSPLAEMGLNFSQSFLEVSLPKPALYKASDIDDKNRKNRIEPRLDNPALLEHIKDAMQRLDNAVILKEGFFSWEDLAEESRLGNVTVSKLAAERLRSIQTTGDLPDLKLSDLGTIVISERGWMLKNNLKTNRRTALSGSMGYSHEKTPKVIYTGIEKLDELLCPNKERKRLGLYKGGFYAPVTIKSGKWMAPIIAIEGSSAEGKTTLSLQIGCNLVRRKKGWTCIYYSLEKNPESIIKLLDGRNYFLEKNANQDDAKENIIKDAVKKSIINLEKNSWYELNKEKIKNKLILARLSPRPAIKIKNITENVFEQRYSELKQSLEWARSKKKKIFYFIDSLTAFSNESLSRVQAYRLLSLFEMAETPVIITLERRRGMDADKELPYYDYTRYIADIVIRLDHEYVENYYKQTIEVAKTRYNRHILGKHLLKIKSPRSEGTGEYDNRNGIVVYHSIHHHIVQSRSERRRGRNMLLDIPAAQLPVGEPEGGKKSIASQTIKSDTCIVISGPLGGHKFAMGVNLLLRTKKTRAEKKKLIVSFAEEREIKLKDVALLKQMKLWRDKLKPQDQPKLKSPNMKVWEQHFGDEKYNYITLLNFRLGNIMPEEFLHIFECYLDKNKGEIDSLLFTDTAQLRTRFSLLNKEPLFLPAVVDLIKSQGLFSIFIDVMENNKPNASLMAAADCRIYIEKRTMKSKLSNYIRIENVRGKDYDQDRRLISAKLLKDKHYILKIEKI